LVPGAGIGLADEVSVSLGGVDRESGGKTAALPNGVAPRAPKHYYKSKGGRGEGLSVRRGPERAERISFRLKMPG
jgi:hypothetical protein